MFLFFTIHIKAPSNTNNTEYMIEDRIYMVLVLIYSVHSYEYSMRSYVVYILGRERKSKFCPSKA